MAGETSTVTPPASNAGSGAANTTTSTDTTVKSYPAFARNSDVDVKISVVHPQPVIGLGNILVLNPIDAGDLATVDDKLSVEDRKNGILSRKTDKTTKAIYREYSDADAVAVDYGMDSAIYKKALTYFAQDNHSDRLAVLDYDKTKALDSLGAFWYFNWTFAILPGFTIDDSVVELSNIFESNKNHFLVVQSDDPTKFDKMMGQNYSIGLCHSTDENMDAALVGALATLTVGSITWKLKSLNGITPESLTSNDMKAINTEHAIAYVEVNGVGETSEGWTLSGEYIDTVHGIMWVSSEMESQLESFLQSNGKISYDQVGITKISGVATQVLEQAYQQGIIQTDESTGKGDYTVTATPRSEQSASDISARHYGGLSFTYHAAGAIHSITVYGEVDSDTIMTANA